MSTIFKLAGAELGIMSIQHITHMKHAFWELCLWNLNLWRWRCRLRLENTMATCCRWAELCRAMFLMELLPITLLSLHSMLPIRQNFMFMPPIWRIANFADGKGEDCDGSDIPKNSKRTLLPRYQQMVVFVSFGSFNDLMKMGIRRRFRMHQGVQPYAYTKTWLRSAIKISGRPPSAAPEKNSKQVSLLYQFSKCSNRPLFSGMRGEAQTFLQNWCSRSWSHWDEASWSETKIHQKQGRRSIS